PGDRGGRGGLGPVDGGGLRGRGRGAGGSGEDASRHGVRSGAGIPIRPASGGGGRNGSAAHRSGTRRGLARLAEPCGIKRRREPWHRSFLRKHKQRAVGNEQTTSCSASRTTRRMPCCRRSVTTFGRR